MAHDVFISYSSRDKPIADAICANIEASGIRCWIAPRDIAPGEDWPAAIATAISESHVMVLVFSAHSNASEDVGREIILAANHRLVIIPFKIDNIEPEPGKQYYLARTHWLDAVNPPTQAQIDALVERVSVLIPSREVVAAVRPVDGGMQQPVARKATVAPLLIWIGAALLLVAILVWAAPRFMAPARPTAAAVEAATPTNTAAATAVPTITRVPTSIPSPTLMYEMPEGTPVPLQWTLHVIDDLSSNLYAWPHFDDSNDGCSTYTLGLQDGGLHWALDSVGANGCGYVYFPGVSPVSDFDAALDVQRTAGTIDAGFGIGFRIISGNDHYSLAINDIKQLYRVLLVRRGSNTMVIDWTYEPAIHSSGVNRLGVSARGPALYFFVNDVLVNTAVDTAIRSGHVGIVAENYGKGQVSIVYDNFSLDGIR
jgi:hypothetical protein